MIEVNTQYLLEMLAMLAQALGFVTGAIICFATGLYLGSLARCFVNK